MPCIMREALLSPGCTRAEMATTRRASISLCAALKSLTHSISHALPASVCASTSRRTCRARCGCASMASRWRHWSVYVYG